MKIADIVDVFAVAIEKQIIESWRHEGCIHGMSSEHINFEIDGKEYVAKIKQVATNSHWSEDVV